MRLKEAFILCARLLSSRLLTKLSFCISMGIDLSFDYNYVFTLWLLWCFYCSLNWARNKSFLFDSICFLLKFRDSSFNLRHFDRFFWFSVLLRSKLYISINVFLFNLALLRPCLLKTPVSTSYAYILMIDYLLRRLVDSQYDSQILSMILIKYIASSIRSGNLALSFGRQKTYGVFSRWS